MRPLRAAGFTLVELLVVIGIIALLLSILLPTLGRVRASSRTAACLGNQRQIAAAFQLYANDYRGRLPYESSGFLPATHPDFLRYTHWFHFLAEMPDDLATAFGKRLTASPAINQQKRARIGRLGYLPWAEEKNGFDALHCPTAAADLSLHTTDAVPGQVACHYAMNDELAGNQDETTGIVECRRLSSLKGRPLMTSDVNLRWGTGSQSFYSIYYVQAGTGANFDTGRYMAWPLQQIDRSNTVPMSFQGHGSPGAPATTASFADGSASLITEFDPAWFE